MIDSWNLSEGLIYRHGSQTFTMPVNKKTYTIGPTGADFITTRPLRIEAMNMVIGATGTPVYVPVRLLTWEEYSQFALRDLTTTFPTAAHYSPTMPNGTLYVWGQPTQSNQVEFWWFQQAPQFLTSSDTVIVPPGYAEAMVYNLAVRMGDQFGTTQLMSPNVFTDARKALAAIKGMNSPSPKIASADIGVRTARRGDFNYFVGGPSS
jgi:hypothetical protein